MQYRYDPNAYKSAPSLSPDDPRKIQHRYVRRFANRLGLAFILGQLSTTLIVLVFATVLSFAIGPIKAFAFFENDYVLLAEQIILSVILFIPPFLIAAKSLGTDAKGAIRFHISDRPLTTAMILFCLGCIVIFNMLTDLFIRLLELLGTSPEGFDLNIPHSAVGIVLYLFAIAVLPALIEEFALRGVVLGSLRRLGDKTALLISSLLFALMHANFVQIPFALMMGFLLGYLTVSTNSIIPSVIIHFINNLFSGIIGIVQEFYGEVPAAVTQFAGIFVFAVLGIIGLVGLIKMHEKPFARFQPRTFPLSASKSTGIFFFTSVTMILNLLLFGGAAVYDLLV